MPEHSTKEQAFLDYVRAKYGARVVGHYAARRKLDSSVPVGVSLHRALRDSAEGSPERQFASMRFVSE